MLTEEEIIDFGLTLQGACVRYPYGNTPLVLATAAGKEFCDVYEGTKPLHLVMKCDPDRAVLLREKYAAVKPGYRCNKKHWNSVFVDGTVPDNEIKELIEHSYELMKNRK